MKKDQTRILKLLLLPLSILFLVTVCGAQIVYRSNGRCSSQQTCIYRYNSTQRSFDGDQQQVSKVSATVSLQCSSVGVYGDEAATRYCLKVSGVHLSGDLLRDDSNDEVIDQTEEDISELDPLDSVLHDPPISPEDKMMSGEFCFVQKEDGKVVEVNYPDGENSQAVNFKKGIAAAFQTNFKGTTQEEEEDTTSLHLSTYRYAQRGKQSVAYRTIQTPNVHLLAGGTPREDLQLNAREEIAYEGSILSISRGSTTVILSAGNDDSSTSSRRSSVPTFSAIPENHGAILASVKNYEREKRASEPKTYDSQTDVTEFKGEANYTLTKLICRRFSKGVILSPRSSIDTGERQKRDDEHDFDSKQFVSDTLKAKINFTLVDIQRMEALRKQLPSVWRALEKLHKDTGQLKLEESLHQLISLEGEHKPLAGYQPAVDEVIAYLQKLLGSEKSEDKQMRSTLYSMLISDGQLGSQMALLQAYNKSANKEEKNGIVTHIAFTNNPHPEYVESVKQAVDSSQNEVDPLLLAYGALASRRVRKVEQSIVQDLLERVKRMENAHEGDKIGPIIHHLHALGNTESEQVVDMILRYLYHSDLDVQLASISALKAHSTDQRVQQHLSKILASSLFEDQLEAIVEMLIEALEHLKAAKNENIQLHNRYINSLSPIALSDNSKLRSLVSYYLEKLGTKEALELLEILNSQENKSFDDESLYDLREPDDSPSDVRVRRGSDWDESNSLYDLVASYSSRRSDVTAHPKHKAYIWGKKFGLSKVYAQVAAGGFAGIKPNGAGYKLFAKVIAKGHAFGKSATALHAEFLRRRTGNSIYQKIYAKVVGKTLINEAGYLPAGCNTKTKNLYSATIKIFRFRFSIFIYVGTLDFYIGMNAKLGLKLDMSVCESQVKACASLIPSLTLRAEGGASATILLVVRGGIEVAASFTYQLEPEVCIHYCEHAPLKVKACINVYHGWPNNYVEIYAYYQLRKIRIFPPKFYWGSKKRWSKLSKRWDLSSVSRRRIWGSCDANPVCPSPPTLPPPILIPLGTLDPPVIVPVIPTKRPPTLGRPRIRPEFYTP